MASCSEVRCFCLEGLGLWKIPPDECVEVDGTMFVNISATNAELLKMVTKNNDNAPDPRPKNLSAAGTSGLELLKRARNEAQIRELQQDSRSECSLFGSDEATNAIA